MLLRFSASNFLSIFNEQELSLVSTKKKNSNKNIISFPLGDFSILPSALIYGPNASGKSNFIAALEFMQSAVLYSHSRGKPEGGVPRQAFALLEDAKNKPSTLEVDFAIKGVRYQYGFEADNERYTAEWLFSYPEGKRRKLFERKNDEISFGTSMKGQKKLLAELMRPNSLFLSTATQNDHEQLSVIRKFFYNIKVNQSISVGGSTVNHEFLDDEIDERTIDFLSKVETGIVGYRKNTEEMPDKTRLMLRELSELMRRHISELAGDDFDAGAHDKRVTIELRHKTRNGNPCYLELDSESSGTKRLLLLINLIFKALDQGSLVVIDEVDASLHTFASEAVIALFNNPYFNKNGAQLIATAHDTNLLSSEFLSRDQIWFTEKNDYGETEIFSLAEIKSRPTDNFELGYLQGRYGGSISHPSSWKFNSSEVVED